MASELVDVIWQGPFDGERADGTFLRRGDQLQVSAEDAKSSHYERVKAARKPRNPAEHGTSGSDS